MIDIAQRAIEPLVMIEDCPGAINVERRSKFVGHARKIDIFSVKFPVAVMKRMHVVAANVSKLEHQALGTSASTIYRRGMNKIIVTMTLFLASFGSPKRWGRLLPAG